MSFLPSTSSLRKCIIIKHPDLLCSVDVVDSTVLQRHGGLDVGGGGRVTKLAARDCHLRASLGGAGLRPELVKDIFKL